LKYTTLSQSTVCVVPSASESVPCDGSGTVSVPFALSAPLAFALIVPPVSTTFVVPPSAFAELSVSVPACMSVAPVYVFVPFSVKLNEPAFTSVIGPCIHECELPHARFDEPFTVSVAGLPSGVVTRFLCVG